MEFVDAALLFLGGMFAGMILVIVLAALHVSGTESRYDDR